MSGSPLALRMAVHGFASLVLAFLVLPILAVIPASVNDAPSIHLPPEAYSAQWYGALFKDSEWLNSFANSAKIALLATIGSSVMGTAAAIGIQRTEGHVRRLLTGAILAPLIVPIVVVSVALYYVARPLGLVGTELGIALGHMLLCIPFVVLNVGVSLKALDHSLLRAAEGLGATPLRVFRTVTCPLILPGLLGGAVFAFITSFDEVIISIFMSGPLTKTLPVKIWEVIRLEYTPVVAVASTLIVILTLALFVLTRVLSRQRKSSPAE